MSYAIQWVRSLIFNTYMYFMLLPWGIVFAIPAIFSRRAAIFCCRSYCWHITWTAGWMIGLKCEVRGTPPRDEVLIAAKHQSFLDVLMIYGDIPAGRFIMKDILKYAPVVGQFGLRVGCIPVKRGNRGAAIKKMVADVAAGRLFPGQLIIYHPHRTGREGEIQGRHGRVVQRTRTGLRASCRQCWCVLAQTRYLSQPRHRRDRIFAAHSSGHGACPVYGTAGRHD